MNRRKRLRRSQRLRSADVAALLTEGRVLRYAGFTALLRPNGIGISRFNVIVPKRLISRAVDRNRMKRQLREWLRNHQELLGSQDISIRVTKKYLIADELARILTRS